MREKGRERETERGRKRDMVGMEQNRMIVSEKCSKYIKRKKKKGKKHFVHRAERKEEDTALQK